MNRVLLFLVPILLAGIGYTGWFGIVTKEPVVAETCRDSYQRHVVTPFIRNWWECRRQMPCGVDDRFAKHNATVRVIQCVCTHPDDNADQIMTLYQKLPLITPTATTTTEICSTVTELGRL